MSHVPFRANECVCLNTCCDTSQVYRIHSCDIIVIKTHQLYLRLYNRTRRMKQGEDSESW